MYIKKQSFKLLKDYEENTFMVDAQISEAVRLLNVKGYFTWSSCGGHYNNGVTTRGYVMFKKVYNFNTLPIGWKLDYVLFDERIRAILEMDFEFIDVYGLNSANINLLSWCKGVIK